MEFVIQSLIKKPINLPLKDSRKQCIVVIGCLAVNNGIPLPVIQDMNVGERKEKYYASKQVNRKDYC